MAKFCTQCGKEIKGNEKFCVNCGAPIKKEELKDTVKPQVPVPDKEEPKEIKLSATVPSNPTSIKKEINNTSQSKKLWITGIVVLLILVIGLVLHQQSEISLLKEKQALQNNDTQKQTTSNNQSPAVNVQPTQPNPVPTNISPISPKKQGLPLCKLTGTNGSSIEVLDVPSYDRGDTVETINQNETFYAHTLVANYKGERWYRVVLNNDNEGYIIESLVTVTKQPEGLYRPSRWTSGNAIINFNDTNVRSGPGTDNSIVAVLNNGNQCNVLTRVLISGNTWYKIRFNGTTGYVSGSFLDVKPETWSSVPVERRENIS